MDLFKYMASVKEIETSKTVSELESLVRLYHSKRPSARHTTINPSDE